MVAMKKKMIREVTTVTVVNIASGEMWVKVVA
jgi:hypothetical protein